LVHDTPERLDCPRPVIEEVFGESRIVERGWINVPLTIVTVVRNPVAGFARVQHVIGLDWKKTFSVQEAKSFKGVFAVPLVVCKLRDPQTLEFLRNTFGVS